MYIQTTWMSISVICQSKPSTECSHRTQRQAEVTKSDPVSDKITISLTWDAFEHHGWEQFSSTVRNELIHAWQYHEFGDADHGATFTRWTYHLDTSQHCERFTVPKWWLVCEDCGVLFGDWLGDALLTHGHLGSPLDRFEGDGHGAAFLNSPENPHSGTARRGKDVFPDWDRRRIALFPADPDPRGCPGSKR